MTKLRLGFLASTIVGAAFALSLGSASAMPMGKAGIGASDAGKMITEVQFRGKRGGARVAPRGGGRVARGGRGFRGGRGGRGAAAAAIGLGVLGAAIAAGAAANAAPAECWIERRPVHDAWGNFVGYRRVRVCN